MEFKYRYYQSESIDELISLNQLKQNLVLKYYLQVQENLWFLEL
jgi:hypothetical protein